MCAIGAVFGILGGVMSAMGQMQAANAQAAGLKAQAAWQTREAHVEGIKTAYDIQQMRRQTETMLGSQTAQWAVAGVEQGGTPEDVAMATVQEREMDVQSRRFTGTEAVNKFKYDAKISKMQAASAKQAGTIGAMTSIVGAIGNAAGSMFGGGGFMGGTSLSQTAFNMGAGAAPATPAMVSAQTLPTSYGSYTGTFGPTQPRGYSF